MADEADIANDAILADLERKIAMQRAAANKPPLTHCEECDEPITPARQKLRLQLCLDCAQLRERASRVFRRD
jgi:RNA polymerase-binding transcription factor DksA